MSAEANTETTTQAQPKSKRLSSLIWILVLWVFVYLISGLDGISWKRAFWVPIELIGAIPTTVLLFCAVVFPVQHESRFRWGALAAPILSLSGAFFVKDDITNSELIFVAGQLIYTVLFVGLALFKGTSNRGGDGQY